MADELYHYGVPGMKWGVRKMVGSTKRDLKTVKKLEKQNRKSQTLTRIVPPLNEVNAILNRCQKSSTEFSPILMKKFRGGEIE